ncbi:hypothetical protein SAMN05519103_09489 [Rhizobiales bacterium GAS113]|nr:hypothetical protein SAMN05519103_09489 [Rhizobiales bacterium GAS113]
MAYSCNAASAAKVPASARPLAQPPCARHGSGLRFGHRRLPPASIPHSAPPRKSAGLFVGQGLYCRHVGSTFTGAPRAAWLARSARLALSARRARLRGVRDNPMPRRDRHHVGADLQVVVRAESELKPPVTLQPHTDSAREGLSRAPEWGRAGFPYCVPARPLRPPQSIRPAFLPSRSAKPGDNLAKVDASQRGPSRMDDKKLGFFGLNGIVGFGRSIPIVSRVINSIAEVSGF